MYSMVPMPMVHFHDLDLPGCDSIKIGNYACHLQDGHVNLHQKRRVLGQLMWLRSGHISFEEC